MRKDMLKPVPLSFFFVDIICVEVLGENLQVRFGTFQRIRESG